MSLARLAVCKGILFYPETKQYGIAREKARPRIGGGSNRAAVSPQKVLCATRNVKARG